MRRAICATAHLIRQFAKEFELYFICDRKSLSATHQVFSFLYDSYAHPPRKVHPVGSFALLRGRNRSRSQSAYVEKVLKNRSRSIYQSDKIISKKLDSRFRGNDREKNQRVKASKTQRIKKNTRNKGFKFLTCEDGKRSQRRDSTCAPMSPNRHRARARRHRVPGRTRADCRRSW